MLVRHLLTGILASALFITPALRAAAPAPTDPKPADVKPTDTKPTDTKPADTKPEDPKPTPKPTPSPRKPGEKPPVQVAITALLLEYNTIMKTKKGEGLRDKSNYFATDKPEGVTAETILAALEKPIGSSDPRADAYVRWQLLSGFEGKFPDELKARALRVYAAAPKPFRHPGLARGDLDRKLNRVGIMNKEAEPGINKDYGAFVTSYLVDIEPALEYRDELFNRLPPSYETFMAGLADAYDRVTAGAPANTFWATLSGAIRSWAFDAKDPRQVRQVATVIEKLLAAVRDEKNKPYKGVSWTDGGNYTGLRWNSEQSIAADKSLEETATYLYEQAKNPGGGLGFKDDTTKKK